MYGRETLVNIFKQNLESVYKKITEVIMPNVRYIGGRFLYNNEKIDKLLTNYKQEEKEHILLIYKTIGEFSKK